MKKCKVNISPETFDDMQEITNWYDEQQIGIVLKF